MAEQFALPLRRIRTLNDLLRQIEKERTGAYQAPYVFSDATEGY